MRLVVRWTLVKNMYCNLPKIGPPSKISPCTPLYWMKLLQRVLFSQKYAHLPLWGDTFIAQGCIFNFTVVMISSADVHTPITCMKAEGMTVWKWCYTATVIECVVLYKCIYTVPSCRVSMVWMLPNILQWSSSDIKFSLSIGWKKICHTTGENIRSLCSLVPKPSWLYLAVRLSERGLWEAGQNKTLCSQVVHVRTCVCSTWRYVLCRTL